MEHKRNNLGSQSPFLPCALISLVLFGGLLSALDSEKARVGARGGEARN